MSETEVTTSPAEVIDPFGLEQEVDILEYLYVVLRNKYTIVVMAMLGASVVFGLSFLSPNIYMAAAVVAINSNDKPGGVSPKDFRSSEAIGLLEHDFVIDPAPINERERMLARMRSSKFSEIFIKENNLIPYIYYKHWDTKNQEWEDDFDPSLREAMTAFQENMRIIEYDEKTGLLIIYFKTRDAELSAKLANKFIDRFNEYSRTIALDELKARGEYLNLRLKEIQNIELQRSIFRMKEAQLAAETLIYARTSYPLEEIQPALPPLLKYSPTRLKSAALSFIGFAFLGVTIAIGSVLLKKLKQGLSEYQLKAPPAPPPLPKEKLFSFRRTRKKDRDKEIEPLNSTTAPEPQINIWIDK